MPLCMYFSFSKTTRTATTRCLKVRPARQPIIEFFFCLKRWFDIPRVVERQLLQENLNIIKLKIYVFDSKTIYCFHRHIKAQRRDYNLEINLYSNSSLSFSKYTVYTCLHLKCDRNSITCMKKEENALENMVIKTMFVNSNFIKSQSWDRIVIILELRKYND